MKKYIWILLTIIIAIALAGCSKKEENTEGTVTPTVEPVTNTPTPTPSLTPTPTPENHDNQVRSKLTGLWVDKEIGNKRPYAIMLNNLKIASPQSGTSEAGVLYEALVEGGITRLMGIFEELNDKRIGSVRSARHYFVSIADEYNAIYVHYGETTYATKKIKALGINNLSGLTGIADTVFFRDSSIKAPHNAFATKAGILKGTEIKKYETEYSDGYEGHFQFNEEDKPLTDVDKVEKITLKFSNYTNPYFTYNSEDKEYYRFQFGGPHVDYNTGKQLHFKNILIQFVKEWDIDVHDYQTMDLENAKGSGYYITDGKKMDITWTKNESTAKMRYYDKDGKELIMNPGKTYIALFPNDRIEDVVISETSK